MRKEKINYRIGTGMILILIGIAGVADLVSLIPLAGDAVAPVYFAFLAWYLKKTGHGFFNWKIFITEGISFVAELVPVVQELPTMIVATGIVIFISRIEDKTGLSISHIADKIKHPLPKRLAPLYKDGVRQPRKV